MSPVILIVEDETAIADNIAYAFKTDGYTPKHVSLGQAALDLLQTQEGTQIALIILDVGLPDINGFEVCRRVRQFSQIPVIFLTARSDEVDRIVGLEIGADDYVSKPFSPRELVARVRAVMRRHATSQLHQTLALPNTEMRQTSAANFDLRAEEARIFYHGVSLNLTRYEYLLLKTLLERPGQLFSRAQLMDTVWTNANDTLDRTVDTHIKSLRAKLKSVQQNDDPIQTHRGMGYSICADKPSN
jgi:two-component system catabolic regulation response regulator CreB